MSDGTDDNERLAALQDAVSQAARATQDLDGQRRPVAAPFLIARVGPRWLALPATAIREVVLKGTVTRIPLSPAHVLGVAIIRGRVVPVISLESVLGSADLADLVPTLPRLVVIETVEAEIALATDEVQTIAELSIASLRDDGATGGSRPAWVTAELTWESRLLCVVDVQSLVATALGESLKS